MTLVESIAIVLGALPVPKIDADEVDRESRLQTIAVSIARASNRATCSDDWARGDCKPIAGELTQVAAELIELANAETALRANVHRDECGPHQCDALRYRVFHTNTWVIDHRARSLWQLHKPPTWSSEHWAAISGDSQRATNQSAWDAAKLLAGGRGVCGSTAGAFAAYATGGRCQHPQSARRAVATEHIRAKLVQLRHTSEVAKSD